MSSTQTPVDRNIAVIGCGYWGKNLVRNYQELGALRLVCDSDAGRLEKVKEQYPEIETSHNPMQAFARDDISGVVIATPAESHYDLAKAALNAGKHVFVEKPLVLDQFQGNELVELARQRELVLMVGHLLQYHPAFIKLKEMAQAGELGRINYICSHRLNFGKIRREENILWSFAPHDISMILTLAGEMPNKVMATGGYYLHQEIADVTTTHLDFPSGLKAHIFVSWLHPFKEQKLVVVGDSKMAVFDDTLPWGEKLLIYPHKINWQNHQPVPNQGQPETVVVPQIEPLRNECQHFLGCIANNEQPLTDGSEGLSVLEILKASQRFLDEGRNQAPHKALTPPGPEGKPIDYFAHPSAVIDEGCQIGAGCKFWHFSHVMQGSRLGENCNIGQNVVIGPDVSIGRGCKVQNNVSVYKGVTLQDEVFCGPSMVFTNVINPRAGIRRMDELLPTVVKTGASLGANCTIVCGNTIGRYAFVAAGAVVTKDIKDHALVMGNPARQSGWICSCGVKLEPDLSCPACAKRYRQSESGLAEND
ncbi:MAG: Gfo/Idh/MocA family oxidoreductase [Proteobacteria bacterium]|nr:Gfo/Idh/MocA family oxidoreductase [Pseudomonadota bacterium]MBU1452596.1 Gfo/Idh/MocA family oxidoreductase [Pseudomonadota bacterium]MBU2467907.1 Gfo/Idh/MocA family oxidoreductase [Pseudomonadota bacterium]